MSEVEQRLEDWNTDCRLMIENGGKPPDEESRRLAFIEMLPSDMSTYATMRLDTDPEFATFAKVKKWALKYIKVQQLQNRKTKNVHLVDLERQAPAWEPLAATENPEENDDDGGDWLAEQQELLAICVTTMCRRMRRPWCLPSCVAAFNDDRGNPATGSSSARWWVPEPQWPAAGDATPRSPGLVVRELWRKGAHGQCLPAATNYR